MFIYYHQLDPFLIQFNKHYSLLWHSLLYVVLVALAYIVGLYLIKKSLLQGDKLKGMAFWTSVALGGGLWSFVYHTGVRWYSMAYFAGVVFAYFAGIYLIKKGRVQIPVNKLADIVFWVAIGAFLGGRLGYCVFYSQELLWSFNKSFPYWGFLKIHEGGMSSHGGILGLSLAVFLYAYRYKLNFFSMVDLAAITGAFGIFFGRVANFINAELFGRVVEGQSVFAVRFPTELYLWATQPSLYKDKLLALKELFPALKALYPSSVRIPSSLTWETWLTEGGSIYNSSIYHVAHLIVEKAQSSQIKPLLEPLLFVRYPSQLYQALLGGLATFVIISVFWLKPRKAGLIALLWAVSYLSFRLFTEFYRQPDSHIGFQLFELTRGQWLSVFLYLIVLFYGYFVYQQKPKGFF